MKFPDEPRHGESVMDTVVALLRWCRANNVVGCSNGFVQETPNGKVIIVSPQAAVANVAPVEPSEPCPFGSITSWKSGDATITGIVGGIIICGDKTWNFDPIEIDRTTNGGWLYYYQVQCEVNRDDDATLLLPGVKTGQKPGTVSKGEIAAGYPDGFAPNISDGKAKITLPIGRVTIEGADSGVPGNITFEPTGCGGFSIEHCGGTVFWQRI